MIDTFIINSPYLFSYQMLALVALALRRGEGSGVHMFPGADVKGALKRNIRGAKILQGLNCGHKQPVA